MEFNSLFFMMICLPLFILIITELYLSHEHSFANVCEACALEKSSVYRYRARALKKLAAALFGGE